MSYLRTLQKLITHWKTSVFVLTGAVLVLLFVVIFLDRSDAFALPSFGYADITEIQHGIVEDEQYALRQIRDISTFPTVTRTMVEKDILGLLSALTDEQDKRGLNMVIATDKDGVTLTRTQHVSFRGDYLFQTTPWGHKVGGGADTVSVEQGGLIPLAIIAGHPVELAGVPIGALFGGYVIDDAYAMHIKEKYIHDDRQEIAFYSRNDGIVATSFKDPEVRNLLSEYFNTGTDWVSGSRSDQEVLIHGAKYYLKNASLAGVDGEAGGILVFFPVDATIYGLLFGILLTLCFVSLALFVVLFMRRKHGESSLLLFGGVTLIVMIIYGMNAHFGDRSPINIKKSPYKIYNSTLALEPSFGILHKEFEQRIAIKISSGGEPINAAQIALSFDPHMMQVADIVTEHSFCHPGMFLEKAIDNVRGSVRVSCATPSPGFSGTSGIVAELDVQPLRSGAMNIHFSVDTEVLANDGLGTNVLRESTDGSYQVSSKDDKEEDAASVLAFSPSHPNSLRWYAKKNIRLLWQGKPDTRYVYTLDHNASTTVLDQRVSTTSSSVLFTEQPQGVYYFHIAAVVGDSIGSISTTKINIDTTPPITPVIRASATRVAAGDVVRLVFESSDQGSGLQHNYYVRFNNGVFLPVAPTLSIVFPTGTHTVTLRAFDRAGNYADGKIKIEAVDSLSMGALLLGT